MRVLFLLDGLEVGGSEKKTVYLANELQKTGIDVALAHLNKPSGCYHKINVGVTVQCLGREGKFSIDAVLKLKRLIESERIDIIICMNLYPLLYAKMAKWFAPQNRIKTVVSINITDLQRFRDRLSMLIYRQLINKCDVVIFGCRLQMSTWSRKYKILNKNLHVIYNGVDTERFKRDCEYADLERVSATGNNFKLCTIGRLDTEKNQAELIRVTAELRRRGFEICLYIAGEGPKKGDLQKLASNLGIDHCCRFLGVLEDVRPLLSDVDLFVLPSISVETFSNSALEAMSMGVPVILSDVGGAREMVEHGRSGFVYGVTDLKCLTDLLCRLLKDGELRRTTGSAGRVRVCECFSASRMVDEYTELLSSLHATEVAPR